METMMQLYRNNSLPTNKAPEQTFTGDVYISGYFQRATPSRLAGASVTFTPGSRTPWKVNPLGQTVVVTRGVGWAQLEGEEIVEIRTGDFIWFPPGQRHWEGARPDQAMTYVAIQEEGGRSVEFREKVTDEEYQKGPLAP
jgi:quercetin dioxygenase-like cupin family protein